jgi:hypothetical protein
VYKVSGESEACQMSGLVGHYLRGSKVKVLGFAIYLIAAFLVGYQMLQVLAWLSVWNWKAGVIVTTGLVSPFVLFVAAILFPFARRASGYLGASGSLAAISYYSYVIITNGDLLGIRIWDLTGPFCVCVAFAFSLLVLLSPSLTLET